MFEHFLPLPQRAAEVRLPELRLHHSAADQRRGAKVSHRSECVKDCFGNQVSAALTKHNVITQNTTQSQVTAATLLQTKGEVLGRLRGVSVKMLMHHSRNSEQKQWDETLVLALSGMGRLFRAHLPLLVPMPAFPQV